MYYITEYYTEKIEILNKVLAIKGCSTKAIPFMSGKFKPLNVAKFLH